MESMCPQNANYNRRITIAQGPGEIRGECRSVAQYQPSRACLDGPGSPWLPPAACPERGRVREAFLCIYICAHLLLAPRNLCSHETSTSNRPLRTHIHTVQSRLCIDGARGIGCVVAECIDVSVCAHCSRMCTVFHCLGSPVRSYLGCVVGCRTGSRLATGAQLELRGHCPSPPPFRCAPVHSYPVSILPSDSLFFHVLTASYIAWIYLARVFRERRTDTRREGAECSAYLPAGPTARGFIRPEGVAYDGCPAHRSPCPLQLSVRLARSIGSEPHGRRSCSMPGQLPVCSRGHCNSAYGIHGTTLRFLGERRARNTRAWFPSAVPGRAVGHPTLPLKVHRPHDDRELHDRGVRAVRRKWLIQLVAATCVQVRLVVPGWGACSPRVKPFDGFEAHRLQGGGTYQRRANVFLVEPQH